MRFVASGTRCVLLCLLLSAPALADSIQTVVGNNDAAPANGTASFNNPDNGLDTTVDWSGAGHVNGPTDIGASMSAGISNFSPSAPENVAYYFFAQVATFTDIVTLTGPGDAFVLAPSFNFTISGNSTGSNIDYALWDVSVSLRNVLDFGFGEELFAEGCNYTGCNPGGIDNGDFSLANYIPLAIPQGQYNLAISLVAKMCMYGCGFGTSPATGSDLSGTVDYNSTLRLSSVTLAPGTGMTGQSGINYSNLAPPVSTPEPASIALLVTGIIGLAIEGERRRRL